MNAIENLFQRDGRVLLRMEDEGMVVAVRTAEITIRKEKHRTKFPWPIQKGGL
jgi:hypothetical protein